MILLGAALVLEASDSSTVNFGANQSITAHSTCRTVTNNSGTGLSVYVPTVTSAEWASFYNNPPSGVTASACNPTQWIRVANLPLQRYEMGMVTLNDGRVLVCGGYSTATAKTSRCDTYNPATNTWTQVAGMPTARASRATKLPDGRVLHCGDVYGSRCDIYNPDLNTWIQSASLPEARGYAQGELLYDGTVLTCGGAYNGGTYSSCRRYNTSTDSYVSTLGLPQSKTGVNTVVLQDGRYLVCGGASWTGTHYARCDTYNPATNTWTQVAGMPSNKRSSSMNLLPNGDVLVCGGSNGVQWVASCFSYNPATNTWSNTTSLPQVVSYQGSTELLDGRIMVCGGYTGTLTSNCYIYQ